MDPPPPSSSSSSSSSYTSFPILAITILGILTTSIVLLSYYLFVTRCRLSSAAPLRRALPHPAAEPRGLDPYVISILPIVKFAPPSAATVQDQCAICLAELRGDDALKLLPACSHAFHIDCADTWLQSSTSCPLCRTNVTAPFKHPTGRRLHRHQDHAQGKSRNKNIIGGSMGDECIDVPREKDESFCVQHMRRSLSMDSSGDRQLILSVREMLKEKQFSPSEGSSSGGGGGRVRRPFFSFGSGRSSRSAVLPVNIV
ncbi:RING-H2 finger protein ATL1-like [Ananas comosus]|uniref:RING-type E3 ubiquitin transferase n=1 Tax=Ananas comosus TaxID=4615 RepID=A0A6P5FEP6_ANACO|nr:RING-H2 finger protein ATL1-like [Ananas comosus]